MPMTRHNGHRFAISLVTAVAFTAMQIPTTAFAQNSAQAEVLFKEGQQLIADKKYAEACQRLAASFKLDPQPNTELLQGECYKNLKKTASAYNAYLDAASTLDARERRAEIRGRSSQGARGAAPQSARAGDAAGGRRDDEIRRRHEDARQRFRRHRHRARSGRARRHRHRARQTRFHEALHARLRELAAHDHRQPHATRRKRSSTPRQHTGGGGGRRSSRNPTRRGRR